MKLSQIEITSFRSIIAQQIPITNNCIGLVGLNESGKTNILKAIRLLDNGFIPSIKDKSKINDSLPSVKFTFDITSAKNDEAFDFCKNDFEKDPTIPYNNIIKKMTIKRYHAIRNLEKDEGGYGKVSRYSCDYSVELDEKYYELKDQAAIPVNINVEIDEETFLLAETKLLLKNHIPEEYSQFYELATEERIKEIVSPLLSQFFKSSIPRVVFWEYDSQYLLPSEITYANFIEDEDPYSNCAPLYNVLLLSQRLGIYDDDDLTEKIREWENDSSVRRKDANIITDDINQYIKGIWPDYDQIVKIELEETKITIHIHDPKSSVGNFYEMESRSQGFKTFISFMLTIAAEIDTAQVSNSLLLLDEPETHLHPSGVRFMREELLKLSKDNYVVFATHSIFMIDRSNIRRHLIVRKESEMTRVTHVDRNNFIQESVIYEALGTTVDEFSIRNKNIVFEGKMDLILFEYLINNCLSKRRNVLLEYELHDAGGTKNIIAFFKNKNIPADTEWVVVLDNDTPGRKVPEALKKVCIDTSNIDCVFYSSEEGKELEDIISEIYIKDAISRTESRLGYSPKFGFVVDAKKTINKNVDEYKFRNNLDAKGGFEATFKDELIELIQEKLKGINETTIKKRLETFKNLFPDYFLIAKKIIESKGVKFEGELQN